MRHSPVRALDPVRDGDVGVQLRVALAGIPVVERGRDHPAGADPADAVGAGPGEHRLAPRPAPGSRRARPGARGTAAPATGGRANAHNADTDFGTENVRSNPATAVRVFVSCSSAVIFSTTAARASAVIVSGSAPIRRVDPLLPGRVLHRRPAQRLRRRTGSGRPRTAPAAAPRSPPSRPVQPRRGAASPVPSQVPGG